MLLAIVRTVQRDGKIRELWLITDRLELDANLVALAYRYRWTVELLFRWLKCGLGCAASDRSQRERQSHLRIAPVSALVAILAYRAR